MLDKVEQNRLGPKEVIVPFPLFSIRKYSGQVFRCMHFITPSWLMQEAMLRSIVLRNLGWIQKWVGLPS